MSDEVQHIDLVLPKNARNVSVTFQIPANDYEKIAMSFNYTPPDSGSVNVTRNTGESPGL